ncbi:MAG: LuxR C-terminal-related transcriptional regulator [Aeromicrobium sp.]
MQRSELERGRAAFEKSAWAEAFDMLSVADRTEPLAPEDVERLATVAFLTGREEESSDLWARAHQQYLAQGGVERAVGCACWLAFGLVNRGEFARAGGWIGRAARLLDDAGLDCVQRGYLMMLKGIQALWQDDYGTAMSAIGEASRIADRFDDADFKTLTGLARGQAKIMQGNGSEGVAILDQVMVAVTSGEVSATVSGLAYCAVISACHDLFDVGRAQEWSVALSHWCDAQPDLVPYSGWCLVHRAEIMQLHGEWGDAADAAERAFGRSQLSTDHATGGAAYCLLGDVHRLRGDFAQAEESYRQASRQGCEPQPGVALLRLAEGKIDAAASTIRRVVEETQDQVGRAKVLSAFVEIMVASEDLAAARSGAADLSDIAQAFNAPLLRAVSAHCAGAVLLAQNQPGPALAELRGAWAAWRTLDVPYEAARSRVLIGLCCRVLGDEDSAQMEFDAARWTFRQLGAVPDIARVEQLARGDSSMPEGGLTTREIEVLRLVASGRTNRAIAADLFLSEKTVARHLSNIFTKLGLPSRAAATAYAYQHDLI